MPTGSGAGHVPPITPDTLAHDTAVALADPLTDAVPVQIVPSAAMPLNPSWPLNDEPLSVPVTCPVQLTGNARHDPVTFDPVSDRSMLIG